MYDASSSSPRAYAFATIAQFPPTTLAARTLSGSRIVPFKRILREPVV